MVLPPAWTLEREFLFYIIFGLTIWAPRLGFSVFLCWQISLVLAAPFYLLWGWQLWPIAEVFFDVHNVGFLIGLSVAWLVTRAQNLDVRIERVALATGLLGVAALMTLEWYLMRGATTPFSPENTQNSLAEVTKSLMYSLFFGVLVYGCASWETRMTRNIARYFALFGASSYVMYLLHEPIASIVTKILTSGRLAGHIGVDLAYVVIVAVVLVASVLVHATVEVRVTRRLRKRFLYRAATPVANKAVGRYANLA
jgi:exopolysaccharide production protein ExoZ